MKVFPAPPADPSEITLQLVRRTRVRAHQLEATFQTITTRFLGFERVPCEHVDVSVPKREWVPMNDVNASETLNPKKETGVWVQCAQFTSKLVFNVPPTYSVGDRIEWEVQPNLLVSYRLVYSQHCSIVSS